MRPHSKRPPITWKQALLLLMFGGIVGYVSFINMDIWGGTISRHHDLYVLGFFAGTLAFLSGSSGFLVIAVKSVSRPAEFDAGSVTTASSIAFPEYSPNAISKRNVSGQGKLGVALTRLRLVVIAAIAQACIDLWRLGGPSMTSAYGRHYWINATLAIILSQLPYAVVLVRTWKVPDRAGIALAMVAGFAQVFLIYVANLRYQMLREGSLSALLSIAVVILGYIVWRASPSRKGDGGLLVSMGFGLIAYTAVAQIALAVLRFWMRV